MNPNEQVSSRKILEPISYNITDQAGIELIVVELDNAVTVLDQQCAERDERIKELEKEIWSLREFINEMDDYDPDTITT